MSKLMVAVATLQQESSALLSELGTAAGHAEQALPLVEQLLALKAQEQQAFAKMQSLLSGTVQGRGSGQEGTAGGMGAWVQRGQQQEAAQLSEAMQQVGPGILTERVRQQRKPPIPKPPALRKQQQQTLKERSGTSKQKQQQEGRTRLPEPPQQQVGEPAGEGCAEAAVMRHKLHDVYVAGNKAEEQNPEQFKTRLSSKDLICSVQPQCQICGESPVEPTAAAAAADNSSEASYMELLVFPGTGEPLAAIKEVKETIAGGQSRMAWVVDPLKPPLSPAAPLYVCQGCYDCPGMAGDALRAGFGWMAGCAGAVRVKFPRTAPMKGFRRMAEKAPFLRPGVRDHLRNGSGARTCMPKCSTTC
jgi:hypothetical protein